MYTYHSNPLSLLLFTTAAFTITVINKSIFKLTMHAVYNHSFTDTCGLHLIVAVVSFRLKSSCFDNFVLKN
jgi:hypothetical protein